MSLHSKRMEYRCLRCGTTSQTPLAQRCLYCQGALDTFYDLERASLRISQNPLLRYFDLLPILAEEQAIWLGEGNTPCINATRLGGSFGLARLFLKDETANPTYTTKDRIASLGLSYFRELGIEEFVVSSTGNSSTSYAWGVQLTSGFRLHVFVGSEFLSRLAYIDHPSVQTYVVDGGFDATSIGAKQFAAEREIYFEGGFFNLARREGLKLAYLEAYDQMAELEASPHFVFQAISSGMGLLGGYKGALEYNQLKRIPVLPHFIGVQQQTCSPMAEAFQEKCLEIEPHHIVKNPRGMAVAILRGNPTQTYPYIRQVAADSGGGIIAVSDEEIIEAKDRVWEYEGLQICHASATAVAGMLRMARRGLIGKQQSVLVNITGADRPSHPVPQRVWHWTSC